MLATRADRIIDWVTGAGPPELRVQIFRLGSFTTAVLSAFVTPLNVVSNMPVAVHVATLLMGLSHLGFFAASRFAGRTYCGAYLAVSIAIIDAVWFWNGGSQGSIAYYYAPLLLFSLAVFSGWRRWLIAAGQVANAAALFVLEHHFPEWVVPFGNTTDRLLDQSTGIIAASIATAAIASLIIRSHGREQHRLAALAERLTASEQRYREVFDSTSDAVFILDPQGRILDLNERARVVFGLGATAPAALSIDELSPHEPPFSGAQVRERLAGVQAGTSQVFEWLCRRIDGECFWSEVALRRGTYDGRPCVIASVRDITTRKLVQHELLANEERLRLAMLASRQGWFEINVQTGTGISSPEYPRILGFEPAEFVTSVATWLEGMHPDDRESAQREFAACIASGETRALEYRRRTKAGTWKWIRSVGRLVERDSAGRPLRLVGMHTDITEHKELEAQLLHSQRLEAVGTLASGVAHDLNNILTPMLVGAGLLRDKLDDPEDQETLAMMESTGRRGAAIVRQLLAFSRSVASERLPLVPADLIREVAQLVRSTFPKEITIVEDIGECPWPVEGDATQLHQVLVNLAVNARDAMPHGGVLTLGLEYRGAQPPAGSASPRAATESFLVLRVADTGHGIPPEIRDRIFDPFFTTKGPGKGTGLGLATVHGIITAHRGFVRFESRPGRGTEFRVYLPISATAPKETRAGDNTAPARPAAITRRPATVLLVDDEPAVLRTSRRMLEREGYEVIPCAHGAEALRVVRERLPEIDLVITDFMMPEMDGPTLVARLRELAPRLTIIGISGLDQSTRMAELGLAEMLPKPFDSATLLAAVRRSVGSP